MVLAGSFKPNAGVAAKGGQLRFEGVTGRVEVWIDGVPVAHDQKPQPARLSLP